MNKRWYVIHSKKVVGPFTSTRLQELAQKRLIFRQSQVSLKPNGPWHDAATVKGLHFGTDSDPVPLEEQRGKPILKATEHTASQDEMKIQCPFCQANLVAQRVLSGSMSPCPSCEQFIRVTGETSSRNSGPLAGMAPPSWLSHFVRKSKLLVMHRKKEIGIICVVLLAFGGGYYCSKVSENGTGVGGGSGGAYVASKRSDKFHTPNCMWAKEINRANLRRFQSGQDAIESGFKPCKVCRPW